MAGLQEGNAFAVPVGDGYVVGVAARVTRGIAFGFFFGPPRHDVPDISTAEGLSADRAAFAARFGTGAVDAGEWPVIGTLAHWSRDEWRPLVTVRHDYLVDRPVGVYYEDDAISPVAEEPLADELDPADLPSDDILTERYLQKMLVIAMRAD